MNLSKLNPWNWFKHEEGNQSEQQVPVTRKEAEAAPQVAGANPLVHLHQEMDRLFDEAFSSFGLPSISSRFGNRLGTSGMFRPSIDISGDDKQYEVLLDVPGLKESDLTVEVKGDTLFIKGEKEDTSESKDKHYYRIERSYGSFQRTLALPEDAKASDIQASLKDGVLKLVIPRTEVEPSDVQRIAISS